MKRKELRKILIPMLALTMALPTPVLAADGGGAAAGGQTADQAVSQQAEQPVCADFCAAGDAGSL